MKISKRKTHYVYIGVDQLDSVLSIRLT
uniref:Uncharacterized protein n=1 Tax=Anguilla anguilla TaxID=7936 RepID=A0A0E9WA81_ANGAN